uniref:CSON015007 protein n=1 Tax=Culicoides sonorensis TaxID=179676 RepID=A0A336L340_CULSO
MCCDICNCSKCVNLQQIKEKRSVKRRFKQNPCKIRPGWYQELSRRQMDLADQLYEGCRDDFDLNSTCNVKRILKDIGISPMPSPRVLNKALTMSRGNDLAFLWFLLYIFYFKSRNFNARQTKYSLKERLLFSCIAHLDMVSTMRGLARILPPLREDRNGKHEKMSSISLKLRRKNYSHKCKLSPYLIPNPRPKSAVSKTFPRPNQAPTDLDPYNNWSDPDYVVLNEGNRWHAKQPENISSIQEVPQSAGDRITENLNEIPSKSDEIEHENEMMHQIEHDEEKFEGLAEKYQEQTIIKTIIQDLMSNLVAMNSIEAKTDDEGLDSYKNSVKRRLFGATSGERSLNDSERDNFRNEFDSSCICQDDFNESKARELVKNAIYKVLEFDIHKTESAAVSEWMRNVWENEIKMWNENAKEEMKTNDIKKRKNPIKNTNKRISMLLKNSLNELAKDLKYVFASLPDACHHPILHEWTRQFYDITYTKSERATALMKDKNKWHKLVPMMPKMKKCNRRDIESRGVFNETVKKLKHKNDKNDINREFWNSLSPFHCRPGMRDVFYAYFGDYESSAHSAERTNSFDSMSSTLQLCTPNFGLNRMVVPKPMPITELHLPPPPSIPPSSYDYYEIPSEANNYYSLNDCIDCLQSENVPIYATNRTPKSIYEPTYVSAPYCSTPYHFGLDKKGLLQIDYSCNWNNLHRYIHK